jgi:hypothetical protein
LFLQLQFSNLFTEIKKKSLQILKNLPIDRMSSMGRWVPSLLMLIGMAGTSVCAQNLTYKYKPVEVYEGAGFFDENKWDFFTAADPTQGLVKYIDFAEANATSLVGTISGGPADGAVYLGVDFSNQAPEGRRSVRLVSKKTYGQHLLVADIYHMPAVCGNWPALWAVGPDWPNNGEIDYIETVHNTPANRMTLHSKEGLTVFNHSMYMTGTLEAASCGPSELNTGCTIIDSPDSTTSGSKFNENLGGTLAAEFAPKGIQMWFFPRLAALPEDIQAGTPNPSEEWGKPRGMFMGNGVDWNDFFKDLKVVVSNTFCGSWAGKVWADSSCASLSPTCEEYVANNPEVYKDAYWAIKSLRIYENQLSA